jgi:hypothetical protein
VSHESAVVDDDVVREVARRVLEQVAPEELVLFGMNSRAYFRDPAETLKNAADDSPRSPGSMVGSGTAEVVMLLTPFALAMVQGALSSFVEAFTGDLAGRSGTAVRTWLSALFRRPGDSGGLAPDGEEAGLHSALTPEQVEWLRAEAYRTLREAGQPEQQARLLSNALAGAARVRA